MLTLVRNVSNVLMACYEIDCCFSFNCYLFTFACAGSLWLCTSAWWRVGAALQLRCCSFGGLLWSVSVGFSSCGVRAQRSRLLGSRVVVARGLSCSAA